MLWARDSASIFVLMNEGTFATGAHMFEMPIVRVTLASGAAERVVAAHGQLFDERQRATAARSRIAPSRLGRWATSSCTSSSRARGHASRDVNPELERARARRAASR